MIAAALTAIAAWLSCGAIAFAGAGGPRFGVVPGDALHVAMTAAAGLVVLAIAWRAPRRAAVAVAPLALTILPWLPVRVPAAFLVWTGATASLPWAATALALAAIVFEDRLAPPRGSALGAGILSFAVFGASAWVASPALPAGDEPHYLVVTQSLLYDHDLRIENNHQRGDYRAYFRAELLPHYVRRGRDGAIYSIHAPGLPALVLPAFALGGYRAVVLFLLLLSASACALAWWLAWRVTGDRAAAWFGWAAVTLSAPVVLASFTVVPDGPGAAVVLVGFWALLRATWEAEGHEGGEGYAGALRWAFYGVAFAALPWMHTRFAVIAATLGGLVLARLAHVPNAMSKAVAFLSVPALSALAWLFFFAIVYGAPDPTAPYAGNAQNSFAYLSDGLGGLMFDQSFGLFATAPVLAVAFAGFARSKRLGLEWAVVAAPYLLAVGTFAIWWAGASGPARLLVPLTLPLAIPAACAWKAARSRGARIAMVGALAASAWCALVMAGSGSAASAGWLERANTAVDLSAASPAFVPPPGGSPAVARAAAASSAWLTTVPWLLGLGAAVWLCAWIVNRRALTREGAIALTTCTCAAAVMIATTVVWTARDVPPPPAVPGEMQALRMAATPHAVTFDLTGPARLRPVDLRTVPIEMPIRRAGRGAFRPANRPLASFPMPPAGSYEVSVKRHGAAEGWIMAGVGGDQFSIVTRPMAEGDTGVRVDLPVAASSLSVRAEEAGRDQLDAIILRPLSLERSTSGEVARHAVRYGASSVFFVDDRSYPEPSGFWVGGGRATTIVIAPDQPGSAVSLWLRNGAATNIVALQSGTWRSDVPLGAAEERRVDVPVAPSQASVHVRIASAATFRPSAVDPNSRDTRLLGVFVTLR